MLGVFGVGFVYCCLILWLWFCVLVIAGVVIVLWWLLFLFMVIHFISLIVLLLIVWCIVLIGLVGVCVGIVALLIWCLILDWVVDIVVCCFDDLYLLLIVSRVYLCCLCFSWLVVMLIISVYCWIEAGVCRWFECLSFNSVASSFLLTICWVWLWLCLYLMVIRLDFVCLVGYLCFVLLLWRWFVV